MQKLSTGKRLYAATDLVNFLECEHLTDLDLQHLETPLQKAVDDEQAELIKNKGFAHEAAYVKRLREHHSSFIDIAAAGDSREARHEATIKAMREGVQIIYQATFIDEQFLGYADFLRRVESPSDLGAYSYEVLDTKLARSAKGKFVIQLAFYSGLLAGIQGTIPQMMYVILGDGCEAAFRVADYAHYYARLKARFLEHVSGPEPRDIYPSPCEHCDVCRWRDLCAARWQQDDHLCQVANILKTHIRKLNAVGVNTLEALATLPAETKVPKVPVPVLNRLRHQASLQLRSRDTGKNIVELIVPDPVVPAEVGLRGFSRMPEPADGDLFFDMEGNPLEVGGLEYLFGLYYFEADKSVFKPFWAHSRAEERIAFEAFMDFVTDHLAAYPDAHIYHYAPYEVTALRKLMGLHGTREAEVDNLLRGHKLVDLYQVVRESIRVSEPKYSIKNIEHFYRLARVGNVQNAGASIVAYEKWKDTQDAQILQDIAAYNHDDVESTFELRQWLLTQRPKDLPWATFTQPESAANDDDDAVLNDIERRLVLYRDRLLGGLPEDVLRWGAEERRRELTYQLLDFHRRAAKPHWWAMFDRQGMAADERHEDPECIAGLADPVHAPRTEARSLRYTFRYPEQEFKLKTGDSCVHVDTMFPLNDLVIDEAARTASFKLGNTRELPEGPLDIGVAGPTNTKKLTAALFRYADSVMAPPGEEGRSIYPAIDALLQRELPRLHKHPAGTALVSASATVGEITSAVASLDQSYLFIQGPPGAGKTYTGSRVIVSLLKAGKRVGVSSNSHKAIVNLLHAIEKCALEEGFEFKGAKKSAKADPSQHVNGKMIVDVWDNQHLAGSTYRLIASTAWLFAEPDLNQTLDYLFVDEAGQVALGMLVPMATSARNIVLLGDQMQLSQPVQGSHPGDSGLSALDYLLEGRATIAPESGIFLGTTWRMHPKVCRFISDAVYDGRLHPEPGTANRELVLRPDADPALASAGIRYLPIDHDGCSQWSTEEIERVTALYANLLQQSFTDDKGKVQPIAHENILVVSPYNMQVTKLKQALPSDARVGTVDKFQGQEAEVVIISMATSSGEDLPRNIEFLYSKNRLNVAISRARCLAVLIANPALMDIACKTPEQMALVNTLCWVSE